MTILATDSAKMKGFYALIISVDKPTTIPLESMRNPDMTPGLFIYVGSAMGSGSTSLERRIARHFRSGKKSHWHIDFLLRETRGPQAAIWAESDEPFECRMSQMLEESPSFRSVLKGFGASDCQSGCYSHLFRYDGVSTAKTELEQLFIQAGFMPRWTDTGAT